MKALLFALLLISIPALALEAEEHEVTTQDHEEVLDCYAVRMGLPVSFSTVWAGWQFKIPRLDTQAQCWAAQRNDGNQWIQVTSAIKRKWIGVVTQGRGNANQWVTSYKVVYSNDGVYWDEVDDGYSFPGNSDRNTHVKHWFDTPVTARSIRLVPKSWHYHISLRFDFIFKC